MRRITGKPSLPNTINGAMRCLTARSTLITKSEELMAVSVRQGVELAAIEAKVLLGYLETC